MKPLQKILETLLGTPERSAWIFAVIKPGFLNLSNEIVQTYEDFGWKLYKTRTKKLLLSEAKELYKVHEKEDFYKDLCKYMSSDMSMGLIFYNPILRISEETFKHCNEIKDIIRKTYGESDMRNVLHSSDSFQAMLNESSIYF